MHTIILAAALISQFDFDVAPISRQQTFDLFGDAPIIDNRPVVVLYSAPGCAPCERARKLFEAGAVPEIRLIVKKDRPDWVELTPTLHYNTQDGPRVFRLHQYGQDDMINGIANFRRDIVSRLRGSGDAAQAPTSIAEVRRVLALLNPQPNETFVDYGCGDGRFLIEAAKTYGCRAVGVELNPLQADRARQAVDAAGLVGRVQIIEGDALTTDVDAQVGVAYLYPDLLLQLKPKLLKLNRFATPYHPVDGVAMTQNGDAWIWQRPAAVVQQQAYAIYGGQTYTGRVCNNPRCAMCNAIEQQLANARVQIRSTGRWVIRSVPCRSCPSGYRQEWFWES